MMSRLFVVAFLLVAVPVAAQGPVGPAPYLVLTVGSGLDLASTLQALHTVPGAQEGNPLLSHGGDAGLIAGKVASTAALALVMNRIAAKGHPRAAKVLGYVAGAALTGLAMRNAQVGR